MQPFQAKIYIYYIDNQFVVILLRVDYLKYGELYYFEWILFSSFMLFCIVS